MNTGQEISVVIAAYNRRQSIRRAIDSVLSQTLPPAAVIIVDDGSSDGTADVVRSIGDPRIQLVEQAQNGGISMARNAGIAEVRTRWTAFQDSDDLWLPDKLEKQLAGLAARPDAIASYCGMVVSGGAAAEATGSRRDVQYLPVRSATCVSGDLAIAILASSLASTQTLILDTAILQRIGGFDQDLKSLVDWELMIRFASEGPIDFVDEPLVVQTFSANSVTFDVARRLRSCAAIFHKHEQRFRSDRRALALMLARLIALSRLAGQFDQATIYMRRAFATGLITPSLVKQSLMTMARIAR